VTKKARKTSASENRSEDLELLDDLIRRCYRTVTRQLDESTKIGDLLKMIELRRKLTPDDSSQKELWKLLERVRRDALGARSTGSKKKAASGKSDSDSQTDTR
jgi:hypothetical protein